MYENTRRYRPLSKASTEAGIPEKTILEWIASGELKAHDNPSTAKAIEPLIDTAELAAVATRLGH